MLSLGQHHLLARRNRLNKTRERSRTIVLPPDQLQLYRNRKVLDLSKDDFLRRKRAERHAGRCGTDQRPERLNIHGAIDLETGQTRMIEAATVNAISMIMLLRAIEAMYPGKRLIHLFVDNARYHHAKLTGVPDQAAFHPRVLSASGSD